MKIPRYLCRRLNPAAQPLPINGRWGSGFEGGRDTRQAVPHELASGLPPCRPAQPFRSGSLYVDLANRTVKVGDRSVRLSGTEYSLLHLFVRYAGEVLTNEEILRAIWGAETLEKLNYLRVYMRVLRKKLENPAEPDLFQIEPAVGCRLVVREP